MADQDPQAEPARNDPASRLTTLIGFDPTKATRLTTDLFASVVKEITDERTGVAKTKAKELLTKAIELRAQAAKARKDFDTQMKKFDKELGGVIGQIQQMLDGREAPADEQPAQ